MQADGNAVLFTRQGSNFVLYTPEAFTGLTFSNVPVVAYGLNGSIVGGTVGGTTYSPSLTFDSAGKITGSDSGGCTYGGSVTTPDTAHNDYAVSFTSSCLSGSTFTGIGAYFPAGLLGILNHASFKAGLSDGSSTGIFLDLSQ